MAQIGFRIGVNGPDIGDMLVPRDIFSEGGLWVCGYNINLGQLGTNDTTNRSSPIQTVTYGTNWKQVSAGLQQSSAIKTDGTLWTWGANGTGALGTADTTHRSSPIQTITYGTNWKQTSCGGGVTAAIKSDGTLWMWGYNGQGQLGTNDITSRSSPIQTVAGGNNWKQVSCGNSHIAAIKTDGTLWLWGNGYMGALAQGVNTYNYSSPVQTVTYGTNWKQVSCGNSHTAAIKTDGTLWVCGYNWAGKLGTNNTISISSPVQTVTYGTNWKQVSCGNSHTAAIKTDGTLWSWGYNNNGEMGAGYSYNWGASSPVQTVTYGTNWKQVSCGKDYTAAIKTDGTLWSWGYNVYGQLGTNDASSRSSPIQTIMYGTNWKQVSCGNNYHNTAIKDDM